MVGQLMASPDYLSRDYLMAAIAALVIFSDDCDDRTSLY